MVVLETDDGRVEGTQEGGHWVFRGIPYAAPPVGPLRFHPPQAPVPWTEVRSCRTFGAKAPQPAAGLLPAAPLPCAEDCLTLNVWTPGVDAGHRPVFVWVHGGGFTSGSGADPFSTGETFAEQGIVFVSMNYRLGALGFLHLADILGHPYETSGNCGLLDVLAALRWVKRHIERFGGDPNYVTLGGVSAGAKLVATHEAWVRFIHTGSPRSDALSFWRPYRSDAREVLVLDQVPRMERIPPAPVEPGFHVDQVLVLS